MSKIEITKKIDRYIRGDLKDSEIDELWIEFLKNPELYHLFETELLLKDLGNKKYGEAALSSSDNSIFKTYKIQFFALAAIVTLSFGIFIIAVLQPADIRSFAIESIHPDEIIGAGNFRSNEQNRLSSALLLNRGLEAALENRIDDAVALFDSVLKNNPGPLQQLRAHYNLGILYYNTGQFEASVESFEIIDINLVEQSYMKEKIMWFLGNAMLQNNQLKESEGVFKRVIEMNASYSEEAATVAEQLQIELQSQN